MSVLFNNIWTISIIILAGQYGIKTSIYSEKREGKREGSEGMVTYRFMNITIMGVSEHAEGGGWHSI